MRPYSIQTICSQIHHGTLARFSRNDFSEALTWTDKITSSADLRSRENSVSHEGSETMNLILESWLDQIDSRLLNKGLRIT